MSKSEGKELAAWEKEGRERTKEMRDVDSR